LLRLLRRPWEITSFLRLAIGAVMRLAQLHQRGLIHRDIERANILATSTGAWRSRGRPEAMPRPPATLGWSRPTRRSVIVGTLAYIGFE
jgi:serine/threonine protein kinase